MCVRAVLLLCPFYNPVGVVLLSLLCVGSLYSLWSLNKCCAMYVFSVDEGHYFVMVFHYNDVVLSSWL